MLEDEYQSVEAYRTVGDVEWRLSRAGPAGMSVDELVAALVSAGSMCVGDGDGEADRALVEAAVEWLRFMRIAEPVPGDTSSRVRHWRAHDDPSTVGEPGEG